MAKTFILHDESLNEQGFWAKTLGCDLSQFLKNPIMLWNHSRGWRESKEDILPIGHWDNVRIEGSQILGEPVFDTDEFSAQIAAKVEAGTLRMASVGFRVIESSEDKKYIKPGQRYETVLKWKLKEVSIVDIGANNNALALYDQDDKIIELSENGKCPLKTLISNENKNDMKEIAKLLKLADTASEQDVINAISPVVNENVTLKADLQKERDEKATLQGKLDAIELSEKNANKTKAATLVDAAIKDGRLNDDAEHAVKEFWLSSFELNFEKAEKALGALPKKTNAAEQLRDTEKGGSAWEKRQKEIDENNKRK